MYTPFARSVLLFQRNQQSFRAFFQFVSVKVHFTDVRGLRFCRYGNEPDLLFSVLNSLQQR